ncbi:MAG: large subunit ribosomal protein [Actinomycetota bacterium]|nr:large subunit ribosomal protein [Actinomycetota bacterium]
MPAVLYAHGIAPQRLAVDRKALRSAMAQEAGLNALIGLEVEGTRHLAMARQLQRDPLKGTVSHVDFVIVRRDEIVSVEVPVRLVGEALEVERADGLVEQQLFDLMVHALPADIPNSVEVDISGLVIGDAVRVSDLNLPPGVTTDLDPEDPVVLAQASRRELEEEEEVEVEVAEGDTDTEE